MRTLIRNGDLRRLFVGAAIAVAAGLAMGAAVQPALQDGILAPQQQIAGGGPRNYAVASEAGLGAYAGRVPEYVIGTDYTQPPPMLEAEVLAYDDRAQPADGEGQTAGTGAPVPWEVEPSEPPLYPSVRGNAWNPSDLPRAPEPPADDYEPA